MYQLKPTQDNNNIGFTICILKKVPHFSTLLKLYLQTQTFVSLAFVIMQNEFQGLDSLKQTS